MQGPRRNPGAFCFSAPPCHPAPGLARRPNSPHNRPTPGRSAPPAIPNPSTAPILDPMKTPKRLEPLQEDGLIDEVVRPLMSGKEASVYVVRCGDELRCAKVYKEANKRGFRQAAEYQEGRKVRSSRAARAMAKGSKYGRKEQEEAWQNAEVSALFRLANAGVRVPKPYDFQDGVLLMELVTDGYGEVAPRLNDVDLLPEDAREFHAFMIG